MDRQIKLARSILESKGYTVTRRMKESRESSALRKLLDIEGGSSDYVESPEMFDRYGEALDSITKFLGCKKEDLCELPGRGEDIFGEEYQELCDYVYDNSHVVSEIEIEAEEGPSDTLRTSVMDDEYKAKYVFHLDGDSYPSFIISKNVR